MKIFVLLLIFFITFAVNSFASSGYSVFSRENIEGFSSDFEGGAIAGNHINLAKFEMNLRGSKDAGIFSYGTINIYETTIHGDVIAISRQGESQVTKSTIKGQSLFRNYVYFNEAVLNKTLRVANGYFKNKSVFHGAVYKIKSFSSANVNDLKDMFDKKETEVMDLYSRHEIQKIEFIGQSVLRLDNKKYKHVLVYSNATEIDFRKIDIKVTDPSKLYNITFSFRHARRVHIENSGNISFGIPGTIFALNAEVSCYESLITGNIWSRTFKSFDVNKNTCQVNTFSNAAAAK